MTSTELLSPLADEIGKPTDGGAGSAIGVPAARTLATEIPEPSSSTGLLAHDSLKYSLLGPSLLKAGQESVDQNKVSDIIYSASKGSKYFDREEERDKILSSKIEQILSKKAQLERFDLSHDLRLADALISRLESSRNLSQFIVHVDCDAFYAAVELLDRPELAGVPFAVGGGVLSTCNYVARKFGCRSGMAGFVARKLCPQLVMLEPDFTKYNAKAHEVRQIISDYDPRFESASIDEAYLNITEYCAAHDMTPADAVEKMRWEIAEKTKITVSAGVAANTRLAKICSNMNKPNGQYVLPNDRLAILDFMKGLLCRKVNGVGRVFERELAAVGIKTCGDVFDQRQFLVRLFGDKACQFLVQAFLGLGRTRVQPAEEYDRKSVGTESTFTSISDPEMLRRKLRWTAGELEKDMKRSSCKGRTLVLKIKLHTFEIYTRQVVLPRALHLANDFYNHALPMLAKLEQEKPGMTIRLMGLRCTQLVNSKKPDALAFFGIKPIGYFNTGSDIASIHKTERVGYEDNINTDAEWEVWPAGERDGLVTSPDKHNVGESAGRGMGASDLQQTDPRQVSGNGDGNDAPIELAHQLHRKDESLNPASSSDRHVVPQDEWWCCPVCLRAQPADERRFNSHIDSCLSHRTILEAVQESASKGLPPETGSFRLESLAKKRVETRTQKKRGRSASAATVGNDSRQKRICFGAP